MRIVVEARCPFPAYLRPRIRKTILVSHSMLPAALRKRTENFEVSVSIVGSREVQRLNREYRGKDKVTDVLSFAALEAPHGAVTQSLGDLVICWARAKEQRHAFGTTAPEELERLVAHGFLHLLGYDHERDAREARRMRTLEARIAAALK